MTMGSIVKRDLHGKMTDAEKIAALQRLMEDRLVIIIQIGDLEYLRCLRLEHGTWGYFIDFAKQQLRGVGIDLTKVNNIGVSCYLYCLKLTDLFLKLMHKFCIICKEDDNVITALLLNEVLFRKKEDRERPFLHFLIKLNFNDTDTEQLFKKHFVTESSWE
jgi:hypothetical protein